jgi:hypothetical protein
MLLASFDLGNTPEGAPSADVADGNDDRGIDVGLLSRFRSPRSAATWTISPRAVNTWHRTARTREEEVP